MPVAAILVKLHINERREANHTSVPMPWHETGAWGCPTLRSGAWTCPFGCTKQWPLCHKFQEKACRYQYRQWYCCKGHHVRQDNREDTDYYDNPQWKKRRVEQAPTESDYVPQVDRGDFDYDLNRQWTKFRRRFQSMEEQKEKQDVRLMRLGFFKGGLPAPEAAEWAYEVRKAAIEKKDCSEKSKKFQRAKLRSAITNIQKEIQNRTPSPSTDDDPAEMQ